MLNLILRIASTMLFNDIIKKIGTAAGNQSGTVFSKAKKISATSAGVEAFKI